MNELEQLKQRITILEGIIGQFARPDHFYFSKDIKFRNGVRFILPIGTDDGDGVRIASATNQKLGFYNATPVAQQSSIHLASFATVTGSGADATINANFSALQSAWDDLEAGLENLGLVAIA